MEAEANRSVYGRALVALGERAPDIVVFEADIAKSTHTWRFAERFPERFFNLGIAEQNMMCMAAGVATTGLRPFANTFAMFASLRVCEMVRTSIAYPRLNVKIVAPNAGVEIAGDGVTHMATEDIAVMRSIPDLVVLAPSDPVTTWKATEAIADYAGPVYMRLGRQKASVLHDEKLEFRIGKMIRLRDGDDLAIIAIGNMVEQALLAAETLGKEGIQARVLDSHTIKPIDAEEIRRAAEETRGIVTAEDHTIVGGLGSAVCEVVAGLHPTVVKRVGLRDTFARSGRDYRELLARYRICAGEIVAQAREVAGQGGQGLR
jgi:transketolase